jgi:hypothetical protein
MKEEKKKLEFTLFDLLKDGATNKDKLRGSSYCDEWFVGM